MAPYLRGRCGPCPGRHAAVAGCSMVAERRVRKAPSVVRVLPAKGYSMRVEPRGFEPLTSAVQSQGTIVAGVRCCSERPAKSHICLRKYSPLLAIVRVGWCTTGVPQLRAAPRLSRSAQALV